MRPPHTVSRFALLLSSVCGLALLPAVSLAEEAATDKGTEVLVIGKRVIKGSAGATGLDLSLRETPQSVTVVPAAQIEDFKLSDANQLLATLPGINVEPVETDRTYYNSRGFDITNFQVDGVGQPLIWGIQFGALDTAIFDRIEAIRGANAMMTGTGNPSATINYIRKRPTRTFHSELTAGYGTWNDMRLTADISGPLNSDGTVAGRFVYANEDKDSWLDYYGVNRNVYYGVLSWDLTPKLKLTGGYSQQDNLATGNNWGALPLTYSDGTPITGYDVSATTAAPWTFWDTHDKTTFGELSYGFDNGWTAKVVATHRDYSEIAKLLYAYGSPDKATGLGVTGMSGIYPSKARQDMVDAMASGPFTLFGRQHQLVIGANTATAKSLKWEAFANMFAYPAFQDWATAYPAEPVYPDAYLAEDTETKTSRIYGAAQLNLIDRLKGVVGFNAVNLKETGYSYGTDQGRSENAVTPYMGATYDLTKQVTAYASYSDIFNPQIESDIHQNKLPAAHGKSYEAGLKSEWFDDRLYATAAVFKSEQYGLAEYAGFDTTTGKSYYTGIDTFVKGYEFELAGRITPDWTVNGGWTDLSIRDPQGNDVRTYTPRRTFKLSTTWRAPQWRDLKLGAALRWQDDISTVDNGTTITQKAYSVTDLLASIRVAQRVTAALNVKNAFDEKYFTSLMWTQAYYAAPRSVMLTLSYSY